MATDNIYPVGINATTGKPEVASTAYSGIAGDFVSVLSGSSGGNAQTIVSTNAGAAVALQVENTAADGYAQFTLDSGNTSLSALSYGQTAGGGAAGKTVLASVSNPTVGLKIQSIDTSLAGAPIALVYSGSDTYRWSAVGDQDPLSITPTALAANTNNYNPTGYAAEIWRISSSAAIDLTGITAPTSPAQKRITLINTGGDIITLKHSSGSSSAANRFFFSDQTDKLLQPVLGQITLVYDTTAGVDLWRDESANILQMMTSFDGHFVQLDGGGGTQTIELDANAETGLVVDNTSNGAGATSRLSANGDGSSVSILTYSSGYVDGSLQSSVHILASTGSNGLIIENSAGDPVLFRIGTTELARCNALGWAWGEATIGISAVGDSIAPTTPVVVLDPDGNYTLTSTPTISAGSKIGQELTLITAAGEANTVTLQDEGGLAGSTLELGAATRAVGDKKVLRLIWNGSKWLEVSYANN